MPLSFYTPRVLTGVINNRPVRPNLFTSFFTMQPPSGVDVFEVQSSYMGKSILPSISNVSAGTLRKSEKLGVAYVVAPRFRPKRHFQAADMLRTQKGMNPYNFSEVDPIERAVASDMDAHLEDILYMTEIMAAQALVNGKIELYDRVDGTAQKTYIIDFNRPSSHTVTLSGTALWSSVESSILGQIEEYANLIQEACSGFGATDLVLGKNLWPVFMNHADVKDKLDNRRIELGEISPKAGRSFKGVWNGLNIWVSSSSYPDISGKSTAYIPADTALLLSTDTANHIEYGLPLDVECGGATCFFSKSFEQKDPSGIFTIAESRPLPMTKHCGCAVKIKAI